MTNSTVCLGFDRESSLPLWKQEVVKPPKRRVVGTK
jgi:hypothetical protein